MTKLHKALNVRLDKAVLEYKMLSENDSVLVAVSGGADSMALLELLSQHIWHYAENIELRAVYIDLGFDDGTDDRCDRMKKYCQQLRVDIELVRTEIGPFAHSDANREPPCFLCSRMKRKKIFESAEMLGCTKIVFGHHKNDIIETLFINMIWGREISTMIPNLEVFQGKFKILRPMVFVEEEMVKKFCRERNTPIIEQDCPTDGHSKRQFIKDWLDELEGNVPGAIANIFASMRRVNMDYML